MRTSVLLVLVGSDAVTETLVLVAAAASPLLWLWQYIPLPFYPVLVHQQYTHNIRREGGRRLLRCGSVSAVPPVCHVIPRPEEEQA